MVHKLHLKAPGNWMNDPNGFIYYKGEYHLFYQHFPYEVQWGTMHWGHAVSKDLITWEHKKIALYPSNYSDRNGCFSGSAIEEDGKLYLYYTGVGYEETTKDDIHHCINDKFESAQLMITSKDGYTFDNFNDKKMIIPPITDPLLGDRTHTRDPKVWNGEGCYYMVLGSNLQQEQGLLLFYKSYDKENWEYVNSYTNKEKKLGWMWECPDLFPINEEHVLMFSPMGFVNDGYQEKNHAICMIASFEESTCTLDISDHYQFVDYGMDLYAPQSTIDKDGERIMSAWIRMPKPVQNEGEQPWIGMMCMPRVVELKNGHIYFRIHPNIEKSFVKWIEDRSKLDFNQPYQLQLELEEGESISIGGYVIGRRDDCICTDRQAVYKGLEDQRTKFATPVLKDGCTLHIFVEKNLIETYVNNGEYVISNVVYDLKKEIEIPEGKTYTLRQM